MAPTHVHFLEVQTLHEPFDELQSLDCGDMSPLWLHATKVRCGLATPQCSQSGVLPPQSKGLVN